jgi:hypothetical protein
MSEPKPVFLDIMRVFQTNQAMFYVLCDAAYIYLPSNWQKLSETDEALLTCCRKYTHQIVKYENTYITNINSKIYIFDGKTCFDKDVNDFKEVLSKIEWNV